jgi:hypothetical protein
MMLGFLLFFECDGHTAGFLRRGCAEAWLPYESGGMTAALKKDAS